MATLWPRILNLILVPSQAKRMTCLVTAEGYPTTPLPWVCLKKISLSRLLLVEFVQQEKPSSNPGLMVQANANGPAEHEKHSSDYQECEQHSNNTSAQWYTSGSFSHPLTLFPAILFSSLHPSVYSGLGFSHSYLFNPPPSKSSNPTKPSLIAAQRQLCTSLCHACFSCLTRVQLLHSAHVPPVLFQTAVMCLSVAQREAECWLFSIPPAVYLTFSWF